MVDNVRTLADGDIGFDDLVAVIDLATGFGDEAKAVGKAAGVVEEARDALKLLPEKAGPVANVPLSEVIGKTPAQIDSRAREIGLVPKGPDPANGKGSYVDTSTGVQRILSNPNDPRSGPHGHVNNARGESIGTDGATVPHESKEAHLPIKVN